MINKTKGVQEEKGEKCIVDSECTIGEIAKIYTLYEQFAPFGMKNEMIRIAIPQCTIHKKVMFGKRGEHIRYTLTDGTGHIDGIAFFGKEDKEIDIDINQTAHAIIGQVEMDTFRNKPQIKVIKCIL